MYKLLTSILLTAIMSLFVVPAFSATIILTSDQQLNDLLDPDKKINLSTGFTTRFASLREICEAAKKKGDHTLTIAFDEFFRQYRNQEATERKLTPDMDEYVDKIKVIADFAARYGMGMGLSLLSPLELGPAFKNQTGENGSWLHYKVGLRDPQTGKFHVPLWQQLIWSNNKGNFSLKLKGFRAYAFKENHLPGTPFKAVDRDNVSPLKNVKLDEWNIGKPDGDASKMNTNSWSSPTGANTKSDRAKRVAVYSDGSDELAGYDRVLVLLEYEVPEMEYFSPKALPFLKGLLDKYNDKGIKIQHFYSDEMHIQQDWIYFEHHDNGQFSQRYYAPSMGKLYEEKFGVPFEEKDILYFGYGPDIDTKNATAPKNIQYVFGPSKEEINRTYLFRDRYYKLLNNHVVDLFKEAKQYASEIFGVDDFGTFGHSSWAESPTVDLWNIGKNELHAYKYEYTPNFIWGNTVQQASAACYDYFKWGEYLEPTRNDFAELGWNDRNYYGAAMSASIGVLNRIPRSYPAFWGMPQKVKERKAAINDAYGGRIKSKSLDKITGGVHRDVDVLILYPMNLVAVEERFGSWMTQYGYANFITAEKLLELGTVTDQGKIQVKDKQYSSVVALFEPLPQKGLLGMMSQLKSKGGKVFWFGPPPVVDGSGANCLAEWEGLFGVKYSSDNLTGRLAPGMRVDFANELKQIPSQYILTDFVIDHVYQIEAGAGSSELAYCDNQLVGAGKDGAYYFGFRPRDDQSASLGYETRTLFEILDKLGAYPSTGKFAAMNDNTEHISRTTNYLATHFPNGSTAIVRHYKNHRETWPGGFSRNDEEDAKVLAENPLPSADIDIQNFKVNGHEVAFKGYLNMAFRTDDKNQLTAFEGRKCKDVKVDGVTYTFSELPIEKIAFNQSANSYEILVEGEGKVSIPVLLKAKKVFRLYDHKNKRLKYTMNGNMMEFEVNSKSSGKWLTLK
ncbi:MAG: hypothetical protein JXQ96_07125 [Cyclobacteriaceae bacterium]